MRRIALQSIVGIAALAAGIVAFVVLYYTSYTNAQPAPPLQPPTLITPPNNAVDVPLTVNFGWEDVADEILGTLVLYDVYLCDATASPGCDPFASTPIAVQVAPCNLVTDVCEWGPYNLNPLTQYRWGVFGVDLDLGGTVFSGVNSFTSIDLTGPNMVVVKADPGNATNLPPNWTTANSGSSCAVGQSLTFQYQIQNNGDANGGFLASRLYVDTNGDGQLEYISPEEFYSSNIPPSGGITPSPGTSCTSSPAHDGAFCWSPTAAGTYQIQIKADAGSNETIVDCSTAAPGSRVTETVETDNCTPIYTLTVGASGGTPQNLFPDGASQTSITWSWDAPVGGVDFYNVFLDGAFQGTQVSETYTGNGFSPNTPHTIDVSGENSCGAGVPASDTVYSRIEDATGATLSGATTDGFDAVAQGTFSNLSTLNSGVQYKAVTSPSSCVGGTIHSGGFVQHTNAVSFTGLASDTDYWVCVQSRNAENVSNSFVGPFGPVRTLPGISTVSITATDAAAAESGSPPTDPGEFTLTRTGGSIASALSVIFNTSGSTASVGSDYTHTLTGTPGGLQATIPAGATSVALPISPIDDTAVESSETVLFTIVASGAYVIGSPANATVTIADNDNANQPPTVSWERPADGATVSGNVDLSVDANDPDGTIQSVNWCQTTGVTCTPSNAMTFSIATTFYEDIWNSAAVADGAYNLCAQATDNVGDSSTVVCIAVTTNNAPAVPTVSITANDPSAAESGTPPSNPGEFTLTRTGPTTNALNVIFNTSGSTASVGSDYTHTLTGTPGGLQATIPAGATSVALPISPIDDTAVESSETVLFTIVASGAYVIGSPANATVTIADNDNVTQPDLTASAPSPWPTTATNGDTLTFSIQTENIGTASAGTFTDRLYVDGSPVAFRTVPSLSAGSTNSASLNWTATCGVHNIEFRTDADNAVSESDETNNNEPAGAATHQINVSCPKPDLVVTDIVSSPTPACIDDSISVSMTVRNQGTADTGLGSSTFDTQFIGSGLGPSQNCVASTPNLAVGQQVTVSCTINTVGMPEGDLSANVSVDVGGVVDELDEGNNSLAGSDIFVSASCEQPIADLNCDGVVDVIDLGILLSWHGSTGDAYPHSVYGVWPGCDDAPSPFIDPDDGDTSSCQAVNDVCSGDGFLSCCSGLFCSAANFDDLGFCQSTPPKPPTSPPGGGGTPPGGGPPTFF